MIETKPETARTRRGMETRDVILKTALEMFLERGYEETTMRAIAERAGVALGNAYYYFRSKEHLIQAFYWFTHQEHLAASARTASRTAQQSNRYHRNHRWKFGPTQPPQLFGTHS